MKTKDGRRKIPQNRPTIFIPDFMPRKSAEGTINKDAEVHTTEDIREILARKRG